MSKVIDSMFLYSKRDDLLAAITRRENLSKFGGSEIEIEKNWEAMVYAVDEYKKFRKANRYIQDDKGDRLLQRARIYGDYFEKHSTLRENALITPQLDSVKESQLGSVGLDPNNPNARPKFISKNGRERSSNFQEDTRLWARYAFLNGFQARTRQLIIENKPIVGSELLHSAIRTVNSLLAENGTAPNSFKSKIAVVSELLVLSKAQADILLRNKIQDLFHVPNLPIDADHSPNPNFNLLPNVARPGNGGAPAGAQTNILRVLGMNTVPLELNINDLQNKLVAISQDQAKWETFVNNTQLTQDQASALLKLAQSNYDLIESTEDLSKWVEDTNKYFQGKDGDPHRQQSKAVQYIYNWNSLVQAASTNTGIRPEIQLAMNSSVAGEALREVATELDDKKVEDSIRQKIHDAYPKIGDPPVLNPEVKVFTDSIINSAQQTIRQGNAEIKENANTLKIAAATSLALSQMTLDKNELENFSKSLDGEIKGNLLKKFSDAVLNSVSKASNIDFKSDAKALEEYNNLAFVACAAVTNETVRQQQLIAGNDAKLFEEAKNKILRASAVANSIAFAARKASHPEFNIGRDEAKDIAIRVSNALPSYDNTQDPVLRKAIFFSIVRQELINKYPDLDRTENSAKLEKMTQSIGEAGMSALYIQKASSMRANLEVKAATNMAAHLPKMLAKDLARRLALRKEVDKTSVKEEYIKARNYINGALKVITDRVDALFKNIRDTEFRNKLSQKLRQNYLDNGFSSEAGISDLITNEIKNYNKVIIKLSEENANNIEDCARRIFSNINEIDLDLPEAKSDYLSKNTLETDLENLAIQDFSTANLIEEYIKAAAQEAGVPQAQAQDAAKEAKLALARGNRAAAVAALSKITSHDPSLAAALGVLIRNGNGDAIENAKNNADVAEEVITLSHSTERLAASAAIAAKTKLALARANAPAPGGLDAGIQNVDTIVDSVSKYYRDHGLRMTKAEFKALDNINNVLLLPGRRAAVEEVWKSVETAMRIEEGIALGKQASAAAGSSGGDMAVMVAGIGSGLEIKKAVSLETAAAAAKYYSDKKSGPIDDDTAKDLVNKAIDKVNAKAQAVEQKALKLAKAAAPEKLGEGTGGLGIDNDDDAKEFAKNVRNHFIENGSLSLKEIISIANEQMPQENAKTQENFKSLYNQLTAAASAAGEKPTDLSYNKFKISGAHKNTLSKAIVVFSNKADPVSAGSTLAAGAADEVQAKVLTNLAAHGVSHRVGATRNLADHANSTMAALAGIEISKKHQEMIGPSMAVATDDITALVQDHGHNLLSGNPPGVDAKNALADPQAAPQTANAATLIAERIQFIYRNSTDQVLGDNEVKTAAMRAVLRAASILANRPALSLERIAQPGQIAGALAGAAFRAGYTHEDAVSLAEAVAVPSVLAHGADKIEKVLREQIASKNNLRLTAEQIEELVDLARGSYAVTQGLSSDPGGNDLANRVSSIARGAAGAAGVLDADREIIADEAKAAAGNLTVPLSSDNLKGIALQSIQYLLNIGRKDAALAVGSALVFALCPLPADPTARSKRITQRNKLINEIAGICQTPPSERQLESRPDNKKELNNLKAGQEVSEAIKQEEERELFRRRATLEEGVKPPPSSLKAADLDNVNFVSTGNAVDVQNAHSWKYKYKTDEGEWIEIEWKKDPALKPIADTLVQCCDEKGKSFATEATFRAAMKLYNDAVDKHNSSVLTLFKKEKMPEDAVHAEKGGLRIDFKGINKADMIKMLKDWTNISMKAKNKKLVDASRPVVNMNMSNGNS